MRRLLHRVRLMSIAEPTPDQALVRQSNPLWPVPCPAGDRRDAPLRVTVLASSFGHDFGPPPSRRMEEGPCGPLRAGLGAGAPASGHGDAGDNHRGPQFGDCARMVHKTANVL